MSRNPHHVPGTGVKTVLVSPPGEWSDGTQHPTEAPLMRCPACGSEYRGLTECDSLAPPCSPKASEA